MTRSIFFISIVVSLLLSSCTKPTSNSEFLGRLTYEPITLKYLPYDTQSTMTFVSENGETIVMENKGYEFSNDEFPLNIELIGGDGSVGNFENAYRYYDIPIYQTLFEGTSSDQNSIRYMKTIEVIRDSLPEKEYLYDKLTLWGKFNGSNFGGITIITSERETQGIFPLGYRELIDKYEWRGFMDLGEKTYHNVYSSISEPQKAIAYMNIQNELIGIRDGIGVFWKLQ